MLRNGARMFGTAAVLLAAVLGGCNSSAVSPVYLDRTQRPQASSQTGDTAFSVIISEADKSKSATFAAAKPQVMNGSTIDVTVTGAAAAGGGYIDAAGTRVALKRESDGTWRGTLQYDDEVNPPPAHPGIDVGLQFPGGQETVRHIPVLEMHD